VTVQTFSKILRDQIDAWARFPLATLYTTRRSVDLLNWNTLPTAVSHPFPVNAMLRQRLLVLAALLVFGLAACSDSEDPIGDDSDADDVIQLPDTDGEDDTDDDGSDTEEDSEDLTDSTDGEDDGGDDTVDGTDTDDTTDMSDTPDGTETCQDSDAFAYLGQLFDGSSEIPNGGCAVTEAPSTDANLDDIVAALPPSGCDFDAGDCTASVDIDVTDAIVTATGIKTNNCDRSRVNFWLQDANESIEVELSDSCAGEAAPGEIPDGLLSIRVGDRISFTATQVGRSFDVPRIEAMSDFSRSSTDDDSVYVETVESALSTADVNKLVYLEGTTSSPGSDCGGSPPKQCYEITYAGGSTIEYRAGADENVAVGTTLQYLGIVGQFSDSPQITNQPNNGNYDWGRFLTSE
jgi:hypothetical protein